MKKIILIFFIHYSMLFISIAQGIWTQKSNFGGMTRSAAIGFSIGNKGYIGTGSSVTSFAYQDFWEWDQTADTWTQKSDFAGLGRWGAVGFSIGTKGYIGTGYDGSVQKQDFWEWDQSTNTWTQKADFSGIAREWAVGFSIGTKGYIGTGYDGMNFYQDFWEWDQATNAWTQKTNFGGGVRWGAVAFSIGTKGYIGTGWDGAYKQDFWEWDGDTASMTYDTWIQKSDFSGSARLSAVGFSIGNKGYIGTGSDGTAYKQDFWEWNQVTNTWTQKANFGGIGRLTAVGFSIGSKGYIGTSSGNTFIDDFWEYCDTCLTGMDEIRNTQTVSAFPNPAIEKVSIQCTDLFNSIQIYNLQGEKIYEYKYNNKKQIEINIKNFDSGTYFYQVTNYENHKSGEGKFTVIK